MSKSSDSFGQTRHPIEGAYGALVMATWVVGSVVWVIGTIVLIGPHGLAA